MGVVVQRSTIVLVCLALLLCWPSGVPWQSRSLAQDSNVWTVERILQAVQARQNTIRTIDATMKIVQEVPEQYHAFYRARYASALALAPALGGSRQDLPPFEEPPEPVESQMEKRYFRGQSGRERHETTHTVSVPDDVAPEVTTIWDGEYVYMLQGMDGRIDTDAGLSKEFGHALGIDLVWSDSQGAGTSARTLYDVLQHAHLDGRLSVADDSIEPPRQGLVGIIAKHRWRDNGVQIQRDVLWLDPSLGMAAVRLETAMVAKYPDGSEKDVIPPVRSIAVWEEFEEFEGIWLPRRYRIEGYQGVALPAAGDTFPPGFNVNNMSEGDFRVETFLTGRQTTQITDLSVNKPLDDSVFHMDFPVGAIVYNAIDNTAYQVGSADPPVPVELFDGLRVAQPRRQLFSMAFLVVVLNVLFAVAAFLIWTRGRRKPR